MEYISYITRHIEDALRASLDRKRSVLLLGPRQTGKTTLLDRTPKDLLLSLVAPSARQRYEREPALLTSEVEAWAASKGRAPLVCVDEVQRVPALMDAVQDLIDRRKGVFVLTGSSARKLRRGTSMNLLPGRVTALRLDPLSVAEQPAITLEERLLFGELPGIAQAKTREDKNSDLLSYVTTYLEQEVRAEALVRSSASFGRFLELAAAESGKPVNFRKLSRDIGVAHTTIMAYYEILEDCLIVERVEPWTESKLRRKLTKAQKYLFFDSGVRRAAAAEPPFLVRAREGEVFEAWVGLQLIRLSRVFAPEARVHFWRDPDGPEVDWVLHRGGELLPVEVKWSEAPTERDIRHLNVFMNEYPAATRGCVVCRSPRRLRLSSRVTAVPWQELPSIVQN